MKKLLAILAVLVLAVSPILANSIGTGIGVDIETEDFVPEIWMCDGRAVYDDNIEPGRNGAPSLSERLNNYAFEGEQLEYDVLVLDKNGINKIEDVYMTIGTSQGTGNDIEVNCVLNELGPEVDSSCNAYIGEEKVEAKNFDNWNQIAAMYTCTLTVETPESMYGEYWVTAEVTDLDGLQNSVDENEYWFFNPVIALTVEGELAFENVRPGTNSYSETLLVGNDADEGSGVTLDMYISGTNFYDSSSSGAMCPTSNVLELDNFAYYAVNGAYTTATVSGVNPAWDPDDEGYVGIPEGNTINQAKEIVGTEFFGDAGSSYNNWRGNTLTPGAEMALTFRLALPEPCNGDFDTGTIYFWGEAI
ncbi:MAG: hypothetical protein PHE43_01055 [Candidatus Nanoarchaeia archaeon]|nr:hypothetical protein [Candidatus Nanoarchaeia archaeon]